ncbi:MAG: 16S rRNA (cytidine(1402)-2'-O)-methyltransferase, partial [Candidatus Dormibacteria bacterium]
LRECDCVVAEDTRHTRRLLTAHGIARPLVSLPAYDERRRLPHLVARLDAGETLALCTDAGTPALSDPGSRLVRAARERGHRIVPVPGPSALTAALSSAGVAADTFCFLGFLPRTPGRLTSTVEHALVQRRTLAFFESPLRIAKTLRMLSAVVGDREVVVARELTKVHESFHVGTAAELALQFTERPPRGECTVLVAA